MKPPKDLASKFEAKLASKAREEEDALEKKRRDEEAVKIAVRCPCFENGLFIYPSCFLKWNLPSLV